MWIERQVGAYVWDPEITPGKMVFLSGPRQVGKTAFARRQLEGKSGTYVNWDDPRVRRRYAQDPFFFLLRSHGSTSNGHSDRIC